MSTEDQIRAVVTLKKSVDVDAFIEDMTSGTNHNEFMPNRKVELHNEKLDSRRNVDFVLTQEEAENLKNDPRIVDVRCGSKLENGYILSPSVFENERLYVKSSSLDNTHYNWAFPACTRPLNPFTTTSLNFSHAYTLTGEGIDVVIQDSGILPNHPEWLNLNGTESRLQLINWPVASGLSGIYTQDPNFYTDPDGHGTHVAGTAVGRLYGWAKSAKIYSMTILDNTAAFGVSASFNMIRAWHNLKPLDANGRRRPTIVNMSWEYLLTYGSINGGNFRGNNWSGTTQRTDFGMVQTIFNRRGAAAPFTYVHPVRVASVDADIEDCIDDGIILIGASGNDAHKIDIEGGQDYNNFYNRTDLGTTYYHRGSTPGATPGVICVGSVKIAQPEGKSFFSNCGPRVEIHAPGEAIQSAIPENSTLANSLGSSIYPENNLFRITKIGGTSMATPQVSGVVACLLEARKEYNNSDIKSWVDRNSFKGRLSDTGGGFTDTASLQGSPNNFLNQTFNRGQVFSVKKL
jgi:subtilisin family serine protease